LAVGNGFPICNILNFTLFLVSAKQSSFIICRNAKIGERLNKLQEGALAHAMIALGHIRGKYGGNFGPSSGFSVDGEYMRTKGWELKKEWEENLIYKFGDLGPGITMD
jgi:hypothetical protein